MPREACGIASKVVCISRGSRHARRKTRTRARVPRADGRWRLLVPPRASDPHPVAAGNPALEFLVANGRLAASEAGGGAAPAEAPLERPARVIDWSAPERLEWGSGEPALLFEVHVPRPSTRRLRVRGPSGVAWALFPPGTDGAWRPRASAAATGVAGGTTHAKLSEAGVWALVLFQDAPAAPGGPVEICFEAEEIAQPTSLFLENAHELRRFVLVSLSFALALALGEAGRTYLHTGNIWTSWGMVPIGTVFLLFPTSFAVTMLWHTFRSIPVLRGEEARRTPTFANRPLEMEVAAWPSVTIQIPVFRECFDDAIRPTLDAAREAARRYREQTGAPCDLLVCEDGLLYFAGNDLEGALAEARRTEPEARSASQVELLARTAYYEAFDVPFVARPGRSPGCPGPSARGGSARRAI